MGSSRAEGKKGRGEEPERARRREQGGKGQEDTKREVREGREQRSGRRVRSGCAPSHKLAPYCQPLSAIAAGLFAPLCAIAGRAARRASPWTSG